MVGAAGGALFGGSFCRFFQLKVQGMLRFCIGLTISGVILSLVFLAKCDTQAMAGINVPYQQPQ